MTARDRLILDLRADGLLLREIGERVGLSTARVWTILVENDCAAKPTALERFLAKVDKDGPVPTHRPELGACWTWLGAIGVRGYGQFQPDGKIRSAQSAAYILFVGPIPDGLVIDHVCHNGSGCAGGPTCLHRRCVNPAHLEAVTGAENSRRGLTGARKTHCIRNHPLSGDNLHVSPSGTRYCRACDRARSQRRWKQQVAA